MQDPPLDEKMDLNKFSRQISRKIVTKLRSKYGAKMVSAKFASLFTTPCCGMQMWHLPSFPHIYSSVCSFIYLFIFWGATYSVRGENLCNKLGWARTIPTLVSLEV